MSKQTVISIIIAVVVIALGIGIWAIQKRAPKYARMRTITIAAFNGTFAGPVYVASGNGYFEDEGLDVTLQLHPSGKAALRSLLEGKADFATVAETPLVHAGLRGEKTYIVATIVDSAKNLAIVARKDKGIGTISDLKGKRIGVTAGTNGEFFMDTVLLSHRIPRSQIEVVYLKPDEMFDHLQKGKVDAVSTWNPHVLMLRKAQGNNALVSYGEGAYLGSFNLAAKRDFVNKDPEATKKILRALVKAEEFIRENSAESRKIIAANTDEDLDLINELWDSYNFRLMLNQALILTMEDQARWAIKNNPSNATIIPNYLDYIYTDALEAVLPDAMTIIR